MSVSDSWPGGCEFDAQLKRTFFQCIFASHLCWKLVGGFGKKIVLAQVWESKQTHDCVTDCHDITLAVKVALNPNTTNQLLCPCKTNVSGVYSHQPVCPWIHLCVCVQNTSFCQSAGWVLTLSSIYTHFNTLKKKAWGKHCGNRWNCSKWAISPISTRFFMQSVYWNSHTMTPFDAFGKEAFWKHCGKRRNCLYKQFLLFPQCFLPYQKQKLSFLYHLICRLQMLSIWSGPKFCRVGMGLWEWVNPFPHNDAFWRPWETSLLKTLWLKEKLLVTSNFSFSHSVF